MCQEPTLWEKALDFHGHSCPGLALGFRAAQAGMARLNELRDVDEEIFAVVENDSCGVDAVMVVSGCTPGKGNLLFKDLGKQAHTFGSRNSGKAVRVVAKNALSRRDPEFAALAARVTGGRATPEEKETFADLRDKRTLELLKAPAEELFSITEVHFEFPPRARIFESVQCAACGEWAMEPRMRLQNGKPVCITCAGD
ncbi:MAG: TraR/DksA C4-type zinc finger protein [Candidatus Desulforudis sp.]|nr:TraR/DksA C4-type zinc finger protein [Desulforudis sp.]